MSKSNLPYPNLNKGAKETLKESKTEYTFITTADKGGTIVIIETKNCIKKSERQLTDKDISHILPQDPTIANNKLFIVLCDFFIQGKLLSEKTAEGLKTPDPRTPRFCIPPKIHESGISGCPDVSSIESHTYQNTLLPNTTCCETTTTLSKR